MKIKVVYSTLLILLASCTSEFPTTPGSNSQEQEIPVQFTFSIESQYNEPSRAVIEENYLKEGAQIGIYALKGITDDGNFMLTQNTQTGQTWSSDNIQTNFKNACYIAKTIKDYKDNEIHQLVASGATGSFPAGENAALRFYAYYPYTSEAIYSGISENGQYPAAPKIPVYIEDNIEDTPDYLYSGPIDAQGTDGSVNIEFKHALARLNIYIKTNNPNYNERECPVITNIKISAYSSQEGTMNIENGNITPGTAKRWDFSKEINRDLYYLGDEADPILLYSNLFIPRMQNNNYAAFFYYIEVTVRGINGSTKIFKFDNSDLSDIVLEKGKITNLLINYDL